MSRIEEGDCDDTRSFHLSCAFSHNLKQALKGKKGQAVLRELRDALEAMPEKRLISGKFADIEIQPGDGPIYDRIEGDVCAMGALYLHRKKHLPRGQALLAAINDVTVHEDDGGHEAIRQASEVLGLAYPLAYELAYENDEGPHDETSEQRYERVLEWVKGKIIEPKAVTS